MKLTLADGAVYSGRSFGACREAEGRAPWEAMLPGVDGILLTNGPSDPTHPAPALGRIRAALAELPGHTRNRGKVT